MSEGEVVEQLVEFTNVLLVDSTNCSTTSRSSPPMSSR